MKKILVVGMSDNIGGMETFFHNYYEHFDLKKYHFDFVTVCGTIAFANEYKKNGSEIYNVPNFLKHPIKYYKILRKIINEGKYDIVHINMLSAANILPVKAALKEKISKVIVHSHNNGMPKGFIRKLLHICNKHCLRDSSIVRMACSEEAGGWMFGNGVGYKIINNAIDPKKFEFNEINRVEIRNKYRVKETEILLGNVGRLCEQKNQVFLIDILSKLDKKYKLMLVGDGDKKAELEKKIDRYSLKERVIFVKNTVEIEKFYSAFDIFMFPSKFEGLGTAVVEAQVNGLRCIASEEVPQIANQGYITYARLAVDDWLSCIGKPLAKRVGRLKDDYNVVKQAAKFCDYFLDKKDLKKVSIIIPVFNNEKLVSNCLDSIINQTYKNIEVIIINDGSTDGSERVIKKYLNDKRVIYIKQKNCGANRARWIGIKHSSGDYLLFVDSDDWIETDSIEKLLSLANGEIDVVRFNHYIEPGKKKYNFYNSVKGKILSGILQIKKEAISGYNLRELAFGMYKSSLFKQNVPLVKRMSYGEDYYTNLTILPYARKIIFSDLTLYHYLKNTNSSTTSMRNKKIKLRNYNDALNLVRKMFEIYQNMDINSTERAKILANILDVVMWSIYGLAVCLDEKEFCEKVAPLFCSDFMKECKKNLFSIVRVSRRRSFKYFIFHFKMIRAIVLNDGKKMYRIACIYNRSKK